MPRRSSALTLALLAVACGGRTAEGGADAAALGDTGAAFDTSTSFDAASPTDTALHPRDAITVDAAPDAPRTLLDIPISAGEMAFNEINNVGFTDDFVVRWSSPHLKVSSTGHVAATVTTTYGGPPHASEGRRDVLFWTVTASYATGGGDTGGAIRHIALADTTGVVASTSDDKTAVFTLDGSFALPPMSTSDGALFGVSIELTWVRVYRTAGAITYHVLPGRPTAADPPQPLAWDGPPAPVSARFGYYAPIAASGVGGGSFDYPTWCTTHLTW